MTAPKSLQTIMHIDDDEDIRMIAKMSLEALGGYSVISCDGYTQAAEALQDTIPDFILIDVMMPDIDGPETLKKLRQDHNLTDTHVAFMTAKIMDSEIKKLEDLGVNGIIKKPFDPNDLCTKIQKMWEQ